jgi:uncharacterized membrane protein YcaP (DUF421 family)
MFQAIVGFLDALFGIGHEASDLDAGQMAVRALIVFAFTLVIVRLGSKRLLGKGTVFDFIVAIMLGSIMSRAITGSSPFLPTLAAGTILVALHWLLGVLAYHIDWFGPIVKGNPVLLIKDGSIRWQGMREGSVTKQDLEEALRLNGELTAPSKVRLSYLELNGDISVIPEQH